MKVDTEMTLKQISRLCDWLKAEGHTPEEIINCIKYMAKEKAPEEPEKHSEA